VGHRTKVRKILDTTPHSSSALVVSVGHRTPQA
jgi:hypothetical protein